MNDRRKIQALSTVTIRGRRPVQEDHVLASAEKGIFVVADGFGGEGPGADAAKASCEAVRGFLEKEAGDLEATLPFVIRSYFSLAGNVLFNALVHANRKVLGMNRDRVANEKGGASVLAGFLDGDLLALANAGACTAWLFRDGRMAELSVPRTYSRLCDPFSKDPVAGHQIPLIAIGMADDLEPEIFECRVRAGDWLLFQTDGLTAEWRERLLELQVARLSPTQAVERANALLEGGDYADNVAASLIIF